MNASSPRSVADGQLTTRPGVLPAFRSQAMPRVLVAYRMVALCTLWAIVFKAKFFLGANQVYAAFPLTDPFFPAWLQSLTTLRYAFMGSFTCLLVALITADDGIRRMASWLSCLGVSILLCHQGTHNDMTFTTAWWSSLWLIWLAGRIATIDDPWSLRGRVGGLSVVSSGAWLARLIASMVLLGGAAGKWTAEYWSGEVLYEIYFVDRDFWIFNWLRSSFDDATLRQIATIYSRKVVIIETVAGLGLWLLPPRTAAYVGVALFASIALFSNVLLFSVLLSLIGLMAVGWLVPDGRGNGLMGNG